MCYDRCLKLRPLGAFLVVLSGVGLGGCGAPETPAGFTNGASADNPLRVWRTAESQVGCGVMLAAARCAKP